MSGEGYGYEAGGWSLGVPPPPLCDAEMTEEEVQTAADRCRPLQTAADRCRPRPSPSPRP